MRGIVYGWVCFSAVLRAIYAVGTITALSLLALTDASASAQQAGVAAGVTGDLTVSEGSRPEPEAVESGMKMMLRDRINSDASSRMQVLLLDETVFTIGPDSDLIIDEFVYDPNSQTGHLTANFTKGVLRYVSGKVAHLNPVGVTIKTRDATIGVRGTALFIMDDPEVTDGTQFIGLLGPGDRNEAGLTPSRITVTSGGTTVDVLRSGYGVFVSPGKVPSAPVPTPLRLIKSLQADLTGDMVSPAEKARKAPRSLQNKMRKHKASAAVFRKTSLGRTELMAAAALTGREGTGDRARNIQRLRNAGMTKTDAISVTRQLAKIGPRASQQSMQKDNRTRDRNQRAVIRSLINDRRGLR